MKIRNFCAVLVCASIITSKVFAVGMCEIGTCEAIEWLAQKSDYFDDICPGDSEECAEYDQADYPIAILKCEDSGMTALLESKCVLGLSPPPDSYTCLCRIMKIGFSDGVDSVGTYKADFFDVPGEWVNWGPIGTSGYGCYISCLPNCVESIFHDNALPYYFEGL